MQIKPNCLESSTPFPSSIFHSVSIPVELHFVAQMVYAKNTTTTTHCYTFLVPKHTEGLYATMER